MLCGWNYFGVKGGCVQETIREDRERREKREKREERERYSIELCGTIAD
jgi:hypothetical protein